jgi:phosphoribosyl 1,2-cyclic phosphodiesterase
MRFCALTSGSSGNCFLVGDKKEYVLIDAGISSKRIVEKLNQIKINPLDIKAIFLTHEHSDHTRGADVFARTFKIPIYATKGTINSSEQDFEAICSEKDLINEIKNNELMNFKGFDVQSFSKSHDAKDPVSLSIFGKKAISVITDAGFCCSNIKKAISESNVLCIESNHDIKMLEEGPYPWHLKKRIKSDSGHLSNVQCSLGVLEFANKKLKNVILSHLSQTNNTSKLALQTFKSLVKERKDLKPKVCVSVRERVGEVVKI